MGGGQCSNDAPQGQCPLCEIEEHPAIDCPWSYTRCRVPGCNGTRKLLQSKQAQSHGRKILICCRNVCKDFTWLEDAFQVVRTSPPQSYFVDGYFGCGEAEHLFKDYPWKDSMCLQNHYNGKRKLAICGTLHNCGIPYLKCRQYGTFEWMTDSLTTYKVQKVQEHLDVTNMCKSVMKNLKV